MCRNLILVILALLLWTLSPIGAQQESQPALDPQLQNKLEQAKGMLLQSNFNAAAALLGEIVAQDPNAGEANFFLGLAAIGETQKKEAREKATGHFLDAAKAGYHIPFGAWENYPVKANGYIEANWDAAKGYIKDEDPQNYSLAIHLLNNIIAVDHKSHDASEHLGNLYVKTGQNRKAMDLFQTLLEANPDQSESVYTLGLGFFDIYNREIAEVILSDLSSEGPEKMTALMKLLMARAFFVIEDYRIASVYYKQCLDDLNEIAAREMYRDIMDVVTPPERAEWKQVRTIDQRKNFFRKFWKSRDPSPTTEYNERLVEHYRRLNYAKQNYTMKQTKGYDDRGIVYIKHGEPDQTADLVGNFGIRDNETWVYWRKPDNFIFHFVRRTSSYFIANSLMEAVIGRPFTTALTERENPENPNEPLTLQAEDFSANWRDLLWSRMEIDPIYMRLYNERVDFDESDYLQNEMMTNFQMDEARLVEAALTVGIESETYVPDMGTEPFDYYYYTADFMAMNANSNVNIFYGMPVSELEFKRDIIGVRVNYESTFAVFDQEWNEVDRVYNRRSYQLSQEPDKNNKGLLLVDKQTMNLPPGDYHYSVSVKDLGSNHLGIYKGDLAVTHYKLDEFNVSQIIVASNITPFDGGKPGKFTRGRYNVMPLPSRSFTPDQAVFVYYEIYNLSKSDEGKKSYNVDFTIEAEKLDRNLANKIFGSFGRMLSRSDEKGKITLTFDKEVDPGRIDQIAQAEYVSIDISDSPAGEYNMTIVVTDASTGQKITRTNMFFITKRD